MTVTNIDIHPSYCISLQGGACHLTRLVSPMPYELNASQRVKIGSNYALRWRIEHLSRCRQQLNSLWDSYF